MAKYYSSIEIETNLSRKINDSAEIPEGFYNLSSVTIAKTSYLQSLLQEMIYVVHGSNLLGAKKALKDFPNPKDRFDFLVKFDFKSNDYVVDTVFNHVQKVFYDLYELRNTLSHEIWATSENYSGAVIFSKLDEESRLQMVRGKFLHVEGYTTLETFNATVRYIRKVKVIRKDHLHLAINDLNIAAWSMTNIRNILDSENSVTKDAARKAFLVFKGTSHLFDESERLMGTVNYSSEASKRINI
ncbi:MULTISPECIES: hypothetical protein [unclassified Sphingomonas]|uniref:hypothetical protein n=1 Tax=unclassified Sphingomonas TaxID=196159 RepID=UPI000A532720|nr:MULTISPECIES: hypothetical protein [unclassified Sphingomonas]